MDRQKKILRMVGIIALVILSGYLFFFIILPMMVMPPPAPLFFIANRDNINHTISVEIFDSENKSIFLETFEIKPHDSMEYDRGLDWCPKETLYWLSWSEGKYLFYVTLDDIFNMSHETELYPLKTVWIEIVSDDVKPIQISEVSA